MCQVLWLLMNSNRTSVNLIAHREFINQWLEACLLGTHTVLWCNWLARGKISPRLFPLPYCWSSHLRVAMLLTPASGLMVSGTNIQSYACTNKSGPQENEQTVRDRTAGCSSGWISFVSPTHLPIHSRQKFVIVLSTDLKFRDFLTLSECIWSSERLVISMHRAKKCEKQWDSLIALSFVVLVQIVDIFMKI